MFHRRMFLPVWTLAAVCVGLVFAQAPQTAAPATLAVTGDVPTPLTFKAEDLAAMPREKATVPDQDGTEIEYEGVPLREILKRAGAPLGATSRQSPCQLRPRKGA